MDSRCSTSASLGTTATTTSATTTSTTSNNDRISSKHADIMTALVSGRSIVEIFLEHGVSVVSLEATERPVAVSSITKQDVKKPVIKSVSKASSKSGDSGKAKRHVIVDRRRKRRDRHQMPSSEEEEEEEGARGGVVSDDSASEDESFSGGGSSDEDGLSLLPNNLGEDDLELLNSLSEPSTSSEEEEEGETDKLEDEKIDLGDETEGAAASIASSGSAKKGGVGGKRQIILAANFSMAPSSNSPDGRSAPASNGDNSGGQSTTKETTMEIRSTSSFFNASSVNKEDSQLKELMKETECQAAVYTTCSLLAEEKTLMALKVFTQWLHSYPIVFATCTQVRLS